MSNPSETTVLVVDDDEDLRRVLTFTLGAHGYEVSTAVDGEQAVAMAREQLPDVIVLDVVLPGSDGYWVLERLREDPATMGIRVLMLSARATDDDVWAGWRSGVDCYLTKPFDIDQVLEFVAAR